MAIYPAGMAARTSAPTAWHVGWYCGCDDAQVHEADLPDRCPCHDSGRVAVEHIGEIRGPKISLGHRCSPSAAQLLTEVKP